MEILLGLILGSIFYRLFLRRRFVNWMGRRWHAKMGLTDTNCGCECWEHRV